MAMNAKAIRKKLEQIGAPVPIHHLVIRVKGDTFQVFSTLPEYADRAVATIRRAGYWAKMSMREEHAAIFLLNFAGTEWQDGMIPENLAALPLRDEPPQQMGLFTDEREHDE